MSLTIPPTAYLTTYYGLRLSGFIAESRQGWFAWVNPREFPDEIDRTTNNPETGFFKLAIWTEQQLPIRLEALGIERKNFDWSLELKGKDALPKVRQFVERQGWILSGAITDANSSYSRSSGETHQELKFFIPRQDVDSVVEVMHCQFVGRRGIDFHGDPWRWSKDEKGAELWYYVNDGTDFVRVHDDGSVRWFYNRM